MYQSKQDGWIEVISGVMFSGKSEELLRRVRRALIANRRVQVFKSRLDDRYGSLANVISHDGQQTDALPVSTSIHIAEAVLPDTQVVAIDEAQFLDMGIVRVANSLASRGIRVIIAGTDMDFRGDPFGPMPFLLAIADKVDKLHAICVRCGDPATRNQRLIDGKPAPAEGPTIQVGGAESYEARCRKCHEVPPRDRSQVEMVMERRSSEGAAPE
ncbi:MAG: thymidine kinase [Gemmatimonadota bacterium]|jgi:thymidine kinase